MGVEKTTNPSLRVATRIVEAGKYKKEKDTLDIFIGDFALHSQVANNPKSLLQNRYKEQNGAKPKRTFINGGVIAKENGEIELSIELDPEEVQDILKKTNKSKLRIFMLAEGVPIFLGADAIEKMKSLQKKKLLQN